MNYNSYSHWAPPKQDTHDSLGANSKLRILIPKVPPDTFRGKKKKNKLLGPLRERNVKRYGTPAVVKSKVGAA